jgi:peptidoglycan/LPS O-acetylase OafA/YrhL
MDLKRYFSGIDGLRAIAIMAVIAFHLNPTFLPGGFVGVDIFFVISGYVISNSLFGSRATSLADFAAQFYKRRFLRILPALIGLLIIVTLFSVAFIPVSWLSSSNHFTALFAFFGLSNFYLYNSLDGYFSDRILFNPFTHTWSLGVEEQFYFIFPVVFYFWLKTFQGQGHHPLRRYCALLFLPALCLISLAISASLTTSAHEAAFYLLPGRFWELGAGAVLFQWQRMRSPTTSVLMLDRLFLLGMVILGVCLMSTNEAYFPFPWAILAVAGSLIVIYSMTNTTAAEGGWMRIMCRKELVFIGKISYSLYLWHWPVFVLFRWTCGLDDGYTYIAAIISTLVLAILSYTYLENIFRSNTGLKETRASRVIAVGLLLTILASMGSSLMFHANERGLLGLSVTADKKIWSPKCEPGSRLTKPTCTLEEVNPTSSAGTGHSIFVIGDSHAGAYDLMVKYAAHSVGAQAYIYSKSGCAIANLFKSAEENAVCRHHLDEVYAQVKAHARPGDIVFLASLRLPRLATQTEIFDQEQVLSSLTTPDAITQQKQALLQAKIAIEKFQALGLQVLIDYPKPMFASPPFRCADWFNHSNPICRAGFSMPAARLLAYRQPIVESIHTLEATEGVSTWDPFPILCATADSDGMCHAFNEGVPKFEDAHHLSGYGNRLLIPSFTQKLTDMWSKG